MILILIAVVSGAAYALFTDTAEVKGISFSAGNADLQFSVDGGSWGDSYTFDSLIEENVYPGYKDYAEFWVKNDSDSEIDLELSAQIVSQSNTTGWNALKNVAKVWIGDETGTDGVGYNTLQWWSAVKRDLDVTLGYNEGMKMRVYLEIPSTADNSIADKIVDTDWTLYGDQKI
jgi:hypothetical protein